MTDEQLAALKQQASNLLSESGKLQIAYQRKTTEWQTVNRQVQEEETRRKYFAMFQDEARMAQRAMEARIEKETV